jgi:glycosyltransferase involved in cell wall biosynthesis
MILIEHIQPIDVIMLTRNSNKPWFKRVLIAIKKEIPIHHFIVVDRYSTDGTINVVREFFGDKAIVIRTKAPLGCARYLGMRVVDTEWFAFIDSDVEVLPGWFKTVQRYIWHPRIYGVQGVYKGGVGGVTSRRVQLVSSPRRHLSIKDVIKHGIVEQYGADTAHVLLRRAVVRLVNPAFLCQLECGEDAYIAWKIVEAGYIYAKVSELQAIHHSNLEANLSKVLHRSFGYNGIFYGIPLYVYMTSAMFRFLPQLFKRRRESLIYLINLIGSIFSLAKTMKLVGLCRERI